MKTKILQVRIEENIKNEAEAIFKNIGLDLSTGVRLYLNRVVKERGIPFPMKETEVKTEEQKNTFDPVAFLDNYQAELEKNNEL